MVLVELSSEEYGVEEFKYDTLDKAFEGMRRLAESCCLDRAKDGIDRRIILNINWDKSEGE